MGASYSNEECVPCSIDMPPLEGEELQELLEELNDAWELVDEKKIERKFKFEDFAEALDFVNEVGEIAEAKGHHPDIEFGWGRAKISLMTHKIGGLSRNDFIVASLIDEL